MQCKSESAHIYNRFESQYEYSRGLEEAARYIYGNGATTQVRAFFDGTGNICSPEKPRHWSKTKWKAMVVNRLRAVLPFHNFKGWLVFNLNQGALCGEIELIPAA